MISVFMPAPGEEWIGDITTNEFKSNTRHKIVNNPKNADIIYLYSKWIWNRIPLDVLKSKFCITTVHHIVPEKQNIDDFKNYDLFTDIYHVPNKTTAKQLSSYTKKNCVLLPYWINTDKWNVSKNIHSIQNPNKSIILASFQRDTEGSSIGHGKAPLPKLEKGPDVFVDIVKKFQRHEVIPFIPGWRRNFIVENLKNDYDIITSNKLPDAQMNSYYNAVRENNGYYLVTSKYEGGPQAIIEAAQTKVKILSTDVGIAKDILHPDCICSNVEEFVEKIKTNAIEHTVEFNYDNVQNFDMKKIVPLYDDFLQKVFKI